MNKRFENKCVLVTGAGSGIGRATALAFAAQGAQLVLSDMNDANGRATAGMARELGGARPGRPARRDLSATKDLVICR